MNGHTYRWVDGHGDDACKDAAHECQDEVLPWRVEEHGTVTRAEAHLALTREKQMQEEERGLD